MPYALLLDYMCINAHNGQTFKIPLMIYQKLNRDEEGTKEQ